MSRRIVVIVAVSAIAAVLAGYIGGNERSAPASRRAFDEMADSAGASVMEHLHKGYVAGKSGEIALLPRPHRFLVGDWDLRTLGTDAPNTANSHPNPWDYLVRVPLVFYGGAVPRGRSIYDPVDLTSIAPTYAALLGIDDFDADGDPLGEIVRSRRDAPPRAVVTIVIDGGGWNSLQAFPAAWPELRRIVRDGTTYVNATVGSAPSVTGPVHANIGTGVYPRRHRVANNPALGGARPGAIKTPTISDVWERRNGEAAIVGMIAYEAFHLGMLGHGAQDGGDKDIAVLWSPQGKRWSTNNDFFYVPDYLRDIDGRTLNAYERALDARDGIVDRRWFGNSLRDIRSSVYRAGTPAFVKLTGDAVARVLDTEPIGADDTTDLIWIELKSPDYAGHAWTLSSAEFGDTLREVDAQIGRIKRRLDARIGRDDYILAISADHGMEPLPELVGGWRINSKEFQLDLVREFGPVIDKVRPMDVLIRMDELSERRIALVDIARFIRDYTVGDNIPEGAPGARRAPPDRLNERLFAGAFSGEYLDSLSMEQIRSFGDSAYPEGSYVIDRS